MTIAEFFMIRPHGPNCWTGLGAFSDRVLHMDTSVLSSSRLRFSSDSLPSSSIRSPSPTTPLSGDELMAARTSPGGRRGRGRGGLVQRENSERWRADKRRVRVRCAVDVTMFLSGARRRRRPGRPSESSPPAPTAFGSSQQLSANARRKRSRTSAPRATDDRFIQIVCPPHPPYKTDVPRTREI
uniref:Uncharacterized protein n=1 Tax=Sipha flava TaxID=143950 RepID=A0A2S2QG18_9HEMI